MKEPWSASATAWRAVKGGAMITSRSGGGGEGRPEAIGKGNRFRDVFVHLPVSRDDRPDHNRLLLLPGSNDQGRRMIASVPIGVNSFYRECVTPTRSQYTATGQLLQRGEIGRQVFLPKATSSVLYLNQYSGGSFFRRANSVSSGLLRPDVAEAVGDPVHMGVHAEPRAVEAEGDDQIRRFATHPLDRQQGVQGVGDAAGKTVDQIAADMQDRLGLVAIEADGIDRLLDLLRRKAGASLPAWRPGQRDAPWPPPSPRPWSGGSAAWRSGSRRGRDVPPPVCETMGSSFCSSSFSRRRMISAMCRSFIA